MLLPCFHTPSLPPEIEDEGGPLHQLSAGDLLRPRLRSGGEQHHEEQHQQEQVQNVLHF